MDHDANNSTHFSIDTVYEAFETEWKQQRIPDVASYLLNVPDELQPRALEELACMDLEWRHKWDCNPRIDRYLVLEVSEEHQRSLLLNLIRHEIPIRRRAGEVVRIYEYFKRFPQHVNCIRDAFPMMLSGSLQEQPTLSDEAGATVLTGANLRSMVLGRILESIAPVAETVRYQPGDIIIREGATDQDVYFLQEGTTQAVLRDGSVDGLILGEPGPGDVVGEMALLTTEPRMLDIVAVSKVQAQKVSSADFHDLVTRHPELAAFMTDIVAERLGRADRDALSGKVLCGHRIERLLGRGANGIVYAAKHVESEERVALKMMNHRLSCLPRAKKLFQQEADIVKRLNHPHIVGMRETFDAFHTCFIVLDYVAGQPLDEALDGEPMSAAAVRIVLEDIGSALHYAHGQGIIHRDVKPSNIMLLPDGRARLMDFGLAASQISDGEICGTPAYMAPEQRIGLKVTFAADWFALGCVGYEMLSGERLFNGNLNEELLRDFGSWKVPDFSAADDDLHAAILGLLRTDAADRVPLKL